MNVNTGIALFKATDFLLFRSRNKIKRCYVHLNGTDYMIKKC